jgi:hypothetical protein
MNITDLLSSIDSEIAALQQARTLLAGTNGASTPRVARSGKPLARKKRVMSAEGRARIAAAQKKRWAKRKATK